MASTTEECDGKGTSQPYRAPGGHRVVQSHHLHCRHRCASQQPRRVDVAVDGNTVVVIAAVVIAVVVVAGADDAVVAVAAVRPRRRDCEAVVVVTVVIGRVVFFGVGVVGVVVVPSVTPRLSTSCEAVVLSPRCYFAVVVAARCHRRRCYLYRRGIASRAPAPSLLSTSLLSPKRCRSQSFFFDVAV